MMKLYIGNKNYSSWSLRPWLLMTHAGIDFEEEKLRLSWVDDSPFKRALHAIAPTGRVPLLVDDGFAIWDSLAIAEYLAEKFAAKRLWPTDRLQRARARSLCAEMHSGFVDLRTHFGMNIEADLGDVGKRLLAERPAVARDLARIDAMWGEALAASGGPFLFGDFSIADAFFAPVCSRVATFHLPLGARAAAYGERIRALPAFVAWAQAARAEHDFVLEDEPYRTR
ncbi:MAG: glutathione S-transferase family protein [Caldimonas sp.]